MTQDPVNNSILGLYFARGMVYKFGQNDKLHVGHFDSLMYQCKGQALWLPDQ